MSSTEVTFQAQGLSIVADRWLPPDGVESRGTVILLHGGGQTRHSWSKTGARFAAFGWTSYAIDARGHGDSEWSPTGDYSMDALVGDLHAIIDAIDVQPILVGASLGGLTSLVAQGESPDLARAMVLVDIAPKMERAGIRRILDFMAENPSGFASLEEVAAAIQAYNPRPDRPVNLDGLKKNVRLHDDGRWYWHWDPAFLNMGDEASRDTRQSRLDAAAANIHIPTLLVRGANSDVVSTEGAEELQKLIPGAQVSEVVAGHMVAGDDNDVFAERVVEFLDDALPA
ncbi:MAG: putative hydrolase [Nocardioidaceae bacterium]|nr:putative hydrolase [Nocardioidaceae bacterium]